MARYDRVLIDPGQPVLDLALQQAVAAANDRRRQRLVPWPLPGRDGLARALAEPAGYRQFNGGDGPARPGEGRSAVVLAWWTDRAGRKHHRVVGRHGPFNRPMLENLLCPFGQERPPLWFVYPDHVFVTRAWGERLPQAICACGTYGPPAELGWMGPCCDACYDLGQEGQSPAPAWLDPRRATLHGEEGRLSSLAYSPDGRTLAAGTGRNQVTLWDTATGLERGRLAAGEEDWLLGVGWLDGGSRIVTGDVTGRLRFYSGKTGLPTGEERTLGTSECFAVSPDGALLGRGNRAGVSLVGADGGEPRDLESNLPGVGVLAFSPDGKLVAGGSRQGAVAVWDVAGGRHRGRFERDGALVTGLAFSPHGQTLAVALHPAPGSGSPEANRVLLWDVPGWELRTSLPGHDGGSRCVAFAPDGRVLATGGEDGLIRLWEVHSAQERVALEWHLDCVSSVAFAPDGLTLASGSFDGTVKLWPREVLRPPSRTRERGAAAGGR
jgi:hypothetical protein